MNTLKNRLLGAALVAFSLMSFTMMPIDPDPVNDLDEIGLSKKNGEWLPAGDVQINGVWYWVKECIAGTSAKCKIGTTRHLAKTNVMNTDFPL